MKLVFSEEVLGMIRLYNCGLNHKEIAEIYGKKAPIVSAYLKEAEKQALILETTNINKYINAINFLKENNESPLCSHIEQSERWKTLTRGLKQTAKKVYDTFAEYGLRSLDEDDLFQAGYFGLENALNTFNPAKVKSPSMVIGYVRNGIYHHMVRANLENLEVPIYLADPIYNLLKNGGNLDLLIEEATDPAVKAAATLISTCSLDSLAFLADVIPDEGRTIYDDGPTLAERMGDITKNLTPREQKVIEWRYSPEDGKIKTLQEIGDELGGITRERVRQIESRALKKLRPDPKNIVWLKDYWEKDKEEDKTSVPSNSNL